MASNNFIQAQQFQLAGSGCSATDTSITLKSFNDSYGNAITSGDLNTVNYGTLEPGTTREEIISFTGITTNSDSTVTLTGVTRGLQAVDPFTADTSLRKSHAGSTIFIITDNPQIFRAIYDYADALAIAGAPDATASTKGIVEMATQAEVDSGDDTGSTTAPLSVLPSTIRAKAYHDYAADSGSNDSYAITVAPVITAYATGQVFNFKANTANTGASTLNVCALGAKTIKKNYNQDLATGDIVANQICTVIYDGTNMQLLSRGVTLPPVIQTFTTSSTTLGDTTTQFDITEPVADTMRYTWDATGTDPAITAISMPVGTPILIESSAMTGANTGFFIVTGSGSNYFEVSNASGVAEINKTLADGYLKKMVAQTYTPTTNMKYAIVEVQGAGAAGKGIGSNTTPKRGGGAGGYAKKVISAATIGASQTVYVGPGGESKSISADIKSTGSASIFGSIMTAYGGERQLGGTATGGDINMTGNYGVSPLDTSVGLSGAGANSMFGSGGYAVMADSAGINGAGYGSGGSGAAGDGSSSAATGGNGAPGVIVVTEYF